MLIHQANFIYIIEKKLFMHADIYKHQNNLFNTNVVQSLGELQPYLE